MLQQSDSGDPPVATDGRTRDGILEYIDPASLGGPEGLSAEQQDVLETINQRIAGRESIQQTIDFLFERTRELCPCDRISVAFVEDDGRRVASHYTRTTYEPVLLKRGYAEDLAGSSLAEVIASGRLRIIRDLEVYGREHPDSRSTRLLLREGVRSSMTCPLKVDDRNVGLLFRSARRPSAYGEQTARVHRAIAERLSQAVEKAYRIEQLAAANRAYTEMLGFVSHELKAPVASMVADAEVLAGGYLGELSAPQRDKLQRSITKGRYLLGLVGEYLQLARIESDELRVDARDRVDFVEQVVGPAVEIVASQIEAARMRLEQQIDANGSVRCDPELMKIVLVNLLGNAAKYGRPDGEVRLTLRWDPDRLHVAIRNDGPGFPPEQRSRLFRKFSRIDTPELRRAKGTGVGLYTCWRIVNAHGGRIDARSEPGRWAEFSFWVPRGEHP